MNKNDKNNIHSEKVKRLLGGIPHGVIRAGWIVNAGIVALLVVAYVIFGR